MSIFGRMLGGAAQSVQRIASKYIDADLDKQRAEFMADLQFKGVQKAEEYSQSGDVQKRRNENAAAATLAAGDTARQVELRNLTDQPLRDAKRRIGDEDATDKTNREVKGELTKIEQLTPAQIAAQKQTIDGLAPSEAKRAGLITRATASANAAYREPKDTASSKIAEIEKALGAPLTPEQKQRALGIDKGDNEAVKFAQDVIKAQVKAGGLTVDEAPAKLSQLLQQMGIGGGGARPSAASIPGAALEALRKNPALKDQFEAKYGKGSAASVLQDMAPKVDPKELLRSGTKAQLYEFQRSPEFRTLDKATQQEIYRRVNSD